MQDRIYLHHHPEFSELIRVVAEKMGIDPYLVEKDYWIMHCLYELKQAGYVFQMKGGTSLSKGHCLINRFSEDIDIHIDPPAELELKSKYNNNNPELNQRRQDYLENLVLELKIDGVKALRDIDYDDKQEGFFRHGGIRLNYSSKFQVMHPVVKHGVLLEISFDEFSPNVPMDISSWAYDHAILNGVEIIDNRAKQVQCLEPGFTLAEKLQAISKKFRVYEKKGEATNNFMRHYYDVYCLLQVKEIIEFAKTDTFEMHRTKESRNESPVSKNQAYLLSNSKDFEYLKKKYIEKKPMYYKGQPEFEEVMDVIKKWVEKYDLDIPNSNNKKPNENIKSGENIKPGDQLFLVDGSTFIFRAFHALPPLTRKSDNLPVGAVSGFCNMLWKLLQEGDPTSQKVFPTHFAVIFDYSEKTFRNDIYSEYKANRPETPEDLRPQFKLIRDAVRAFNVSCIEQEGWEADDIIATYAVQAAKAGANVTIISSDKDLMQLIRPGISMVDTLRDRRIDSPEVKEKFGVLPDKVIEVQALAGDSTDNIPGVPGIGVKIAAELINEYGDLETLLARADEIKQNKRRENLIEFAEQARISHKLVTLSQEVPLKEPLESLAVEKLDGKQAIAFLKAMEFTSLTKRVADKTSTKIDSVEPAEIEIVKWKTGLHATEEPEVDEKLTPVAETQRILKNIRSVPIDASKYETVRTIEQLKEWIEDAKSTGIVAVDTETTSLDAMEAELVGVSLSTSLGKACYIPIQHREGERDLLGGGEISEGQISMEKALGLLKPLLEDPAILKIGHNLKYDWLVLYRNGIEIDSYDDTMLISYVLDAGKGQNSMDKLSEKWLGHKTISFNELTGTGKSRITFDQVPIENATPYAAEDADVTFRLWKVLKPRLAAEKMTTVYETLERDMVTVLARMEERGICIDQQKLSHLSLEFDQSASEIEVEIHDLAGEQFNIASPKQLGEILFTKMGFPESKKKTSKGGRSTDVDVLEELATSDEVEETLRKLPAKIIEWRQLSKLKSTYTDALPKFINSESQRVHTNLSLASTTTGRLSSSEPNLQNIPIRTEEGRKIRQAFISQPGTKLVSADYSQIELRILAHIAEIPQLREAFANGVDIHALTASEMFGVPVEGMDPMVRRRAKAINFGIIYGISAHGLANQLGISRTEAGDYIKKYFEKFPGIQDYMEETKKFVHENEFVKTIFGRKVHYPGINTGNFSHKAFFERAAINAPIQGSASDIIRRAMIRMDRELAENDVSAKMLLQVHDELIFEVPDEFVEKLISVVKNVMTNAPLPAVSLKVPLLVEATAADNWDEAH